MFMRILLKRLPKSTAVTQIRTLYNRARGRIPKQWVGPKLKRAMVCTGVTSSAGCFVYYLSQDQPRMVEMFGAHEHVPKLALYPKRGGSNDLPIAEYFIDDHQDELYKTNQKPRLVIIGSGWGAVSVLNSLDRDKYNVTIVSENNYFLFTPLLPSATVGTLELRSLIEPIRKIASRTQAHFVEGKAVDVDLDNKYLEVRGCNKQENFYIPYDKLIVAVGAAGITHGVEGIENTVQLKTINDAMNIRRIVTRNVEKACLPTTSPDERKRLLSFVICGGGPTGVEFAAEMSDWINEDLVRWFPGLIREDISIHIIQSRDHILNTFDSKISEYAEKRFEREHVNIITNSRVERVEKDKVVYKLKSSSAHFDNEPTYESIPYGLCLWSTGIAMTPFAKKLTEKLPSQAHKRVLTTDGYMHLEGVEDNSIFALGDCATIDNPKLSNHIMELFEEADQNKDGKLELDEFFTVCNNIRKRYPLTEEHLTNLKKLFAKYDKDRDGVLSMDDMKHMLGDIDKKMTSLPATAQVASQQGKYLAEFLNKTVSKDSEKYTELALGPFRYHHLGSLAYLGNTAVGDFKWGYQMIGGLWALYLWRSVYWSEQVSMRTRMNLSLDWSKCAIWGRDISTF